MPRFQLLFLYFVTSTMNSKHWSVFRLTLHLSHACSERKSQLFSPTTLGNINPPRSFRGKLITDSNFKSLLHVLLLWVNNSCGLHILLSCSQEKKTPPAPVCWKPFVIPWPWFHPWIFLFICTFWPAAMEILDPSRGSSCVKSIFCSVLTYANNDLCAGASPRVFKKRESDSSSVFPHLGHFPHRSFPTLFALKPGL